jgi:hypothetical protein
MSSPNNVGWGQEENGRNPFEFDSSGGDQDKIAGKLKMCMYLLFFLAAMRVLGLQFFWMINDLLAAFIVYCAYTSKGKFMAIFSLINGIFGIIYEITLAPVELTRFKALNNNQGSNINMNSNSSGNNLDSNLNNPNYDNMNNDPNFLNNSFNRSTSSLSFIYSMMVINLFLALVIYSLITYYSYKAFHTFGSPFGNIDQGPENYNDYGGVGYTNNRQREREREQNYEYSNRASTRYVPFSGRGQSVGGVGSS